MDHHKLERDLAGEVRGEVRFDAGARAVYATDASNYRQVPIGVVCPRSVEDVVRAVLVCRAHDVPVLPRGAGTSLAGQCCNVAVVLDCAKHLDRVVEIDPERRLARVEPGVRLDQLRDLARPHGLTFGPDPATHRWCTFGGMIGNNSCGVHSVTSGRTSDNVHELDVLTYDGVRMRVGATSPETLGRLEREGGRAFEIHRRFVELGERHAAEIRRRFPQIPRRVSGYNLDELLPGSEINVARALTGTEGTCVTILEAAVRLVPLSAHRALVVLGFEDIYQAADQVPRILEHGPEGLEGIDDSLLGRHPQGAALLPAGRAWLLVEFGAADPAEARARGRSLIAALERGPRRPSSRLSTDAREAARVWEVREAGLATTARIPGRNDCWPGWEDAAVHPDRLGDYLRDFHALLDRHGYTAALYGHFGQACVHCRIDFELRTREGIERFSRFIDQAADLVVRYGGSFSGEHGDGQARAVFLPRMFGDELVGAMRDFKRLWDPGGRMNPGKVIDPSPPERNLRLAVAATPDTVETHFGYPEDEGSFARAALRCVGVGKCLRRDEAFMCPSFLVTRDEEHSTRGRARLLHEMMLRGVLTDGWRDDAVRRALDLCLACKGCKRECPARVDMATYRAEFLAQHYRGRLRPRSDYLMAHIGLVARIGALAPRVANGMLQGRMTGPLIKRAWGIGVERRLPVLARATFSSGVGRRPESESRGRPVLLWPDVYTDHFRPGALSAALRLLRGFGFRVHVPRRSLHDPRALIHHGFLSRAKAELRAILAGLAPWIREGVPVVALEPSVVSVFRDDLGQLLPSDPQARRAGALFLTLAEFLSRERVELPRCPSRVLLHVHCHEKAVLEADATRGVLESMGARVEEPESGCCGMAGSFGFEAEHVDLSKRIGELRLLPAVRAAEPGTVVVADGFSCREQIEQGSGRRPVHLAELIDAHFPAGPWVAAGPGERHR